MKKLNAVWQKNMVEKIHNKEQIEHTTNYNLSIQWLIIKLDANKIPYKLYNLGAGVKKITTNTSICPCCLKEISHG